MFIRWLSVKDFNCLIIFWFGRRKSICASETTQVYMEDSTRISLTLAFPALLVVFLLRSRIYLLFVTEKLGFLISVSHRVSCVWLPSSSSSSFPSWWCTRVFVFCALALVVRCFFLPSCKHFEIDRNFWWAIPSWGNVHAKMVFAMWFAKLCASISINMMVMVCCCRHHHQFQHRRYHHWIGHSIAYHEALI